MPESIPPSMPVNRSLGAWLARNRKIAILLAIGLVLIIIVVYRFWPTSSTRSNTNTTNQTTNSTTTNTTTGARGFESFQADLTTNAPVVETRRPTAEETAQAIKDLESSTNTNTP